MAYGKRMKKTATRSKKKPPVRKKPVVRGAGAKKKGTRRLVDDPAYRRARQNRMTESKIARNARTRTPQSQARNRMRAAQIRRGIAQPYRSGPDL